MSLDPPFCHSHGTAPGRRRRPWDLTEDAGLRETSPTGPWAVGKQEAFRSPRSCPCSPGASPGCLSAVKPILSVGRAAAWSRLPKCDSQSSWDMQMWSGGSGCPDASTAAWEPRREHQGTACVSRKGSRSGPRVPPEHTGTWPPAASTARRQQVDRPWGDKVARRRMSAVPLWAPLPGTDGDVSSVAPLAPESLGNNLTTDESEPGSTCKNKPGTLLPPLVQGQAAPCSAPAPHPHPDMTACPPACCSVGLRQPGSLCQPHTSLEKYRCPVGEREQSRGDLSMERSPRGPRCRPGGTCGQDR